MRVTGRSGAVLGLALLLGGPGAAADLDRLGVAEPSLTARLRFFPRSDGIDRPPVYAVQNRRVPVPTNAPDDPSYVGSEYGLSHPSYYGFTPPLGVDDPFGRSLLPYCP